jgi:hypothetical protein
MRDRLDLHLNRPEVQLETLSGKSLHLARFAAFTPLFLRGSVANVDSATENFALTPSDSEAFAGIDSGSELFALSASASETYASGAVDAATEPLALTPLLTAEDHTTFDTDTERLSFGPAGFDEHTTFDLATEMLLLTVTSHDCYAIATPEYVVTLEKRWDMQTPFARWGVDSVSKRWSTEIIGVGFVIPC